MSLPGTGRATRSGPGHVDLVDTFETGGGVRRQHTCQSGREPGADNDVAPPPPRLGVEPEQRLHLGAVVGGRHDVGAAFDGTLGDGPMPGWGREDDNVALLERDRRVVAHPRHVTERRGRRCGARAVDVHDNEIIDVSRRQQLASGSGADRADAHHDGPHYRRSGPLSSRQPPPCGGTPPLPRSRSTAATSPPIPRASNERLSAFTWG